MAANVRKQALERLLQWDSKDSPLAPLTEAQKASVVEVSTLNQRPVPSKVSSDRYNGRFKVKVMLPLISHIDILYCLLHFCPKILKLIEILILT